MKKRGRPINTNKVEATIDIENGMEFDEWNKKWGFSRQTYYNWKDGRTLTVSFSIPPDLYDKIRAASEERRSSVSALIRESIKSWLSEENRNGLSYQE